MISNFNKIKVFSPGLTIAISILALFKKLERF